MLCNVSNLFDCANNRCINLSLVCNGIDDCFDGSDESFTLCTSGFKVTGTIIAGIVIGVVVGIAILCCLVGTVVDCFVHIYKYWCSCLHKAYHYQTEMTTFRSPRQSPTEPANLIVRALPPSYSAITIRCESPDEAAPQASGTNTTLEPDMYGLAKELKLHESYYYMKKTKVTTTKGMPPSYSSLFLRSDSVGEDRVVLNTAYETQSLLHHSPEEERRNVFLDRDQPTSSSSSGRRHYHRYWDISPT